MLRFGIALRIALWLAVVLPLPWAWSQERPPNLIILFADDLGYGDLGSYGHPAIRTPNLDALAHEGQRWTDFYVAAPVCSPSRGALLTGKLPIHSGLYGRRVGVLFPGQPGGIPDEETTLAEVLRELGYASGIIGKWHLGDRPEDLPTRHGFDFWYGLPYSNDMDWSTDLGVEAFFNPKREYWNVPLIRSHTGESGHSDQILERPTDQASLTRRYTEQAVEFIEAHSDRPFLLYLPYTMPHTPLFASESFSGTSLAGRYGDVVEEIDWSVGEIRRGLERAGVAHTSLVFFSSDNGPWLSMRNDRGSAGPMRNGKGTTFEGGVRVPAVFWWPGTVAPRVVRGIGSTMDIVPTFVTLAGGSEPVGIDGFDLSTTLTQNAAVAREVLPYYRGGELYALRKGPYKIHLITEGAFGFGPERAEHQVPLLYHLGEDPGESHDLSSERPEVLKVMLEAVAEHRASVSPVPSLFDQGKTPFGG